jgi:hypothetical protein
MEHVFFILVVIAALVAAGLFAYYSHLAAKKRREEMQAFATSLGWTFDPEKDGNHDDEYAAFEIFRRGHSRAAYNTLRGDATIAGRAFPAKMGDFTYKVTRNSGKSRTTHTYHFSYLILHLPFAGVPDLLIRREGLFDKLAGAFGFDDIDFESAEFSRKFHVKSPDKKFAFGVIDARMMEFLLEGEAPCVDIEAGRSCFSDGQRRWTPDEFKALLSWTSEFFSRWPSHLTSRLEAISPQRHRDTEGE